MNLGFFASHNGSAAHAITDACLEGDIMASPVFLLSNNAGSNALQWSENKGLKTACLNKSTHEAPTDLDHAIAEKLRDYKIDMICLSGYMKLIGPRTMAAVGGKILNIHPALLPKHGGKGMYSAHVHRAVKESGDTETGCTLHLVNDKYDEGRILAQKKIAIETSDSAEEIGQKVHAIEADFYIDTLSKIIKGEIALD